MSIALVARVVAYGFPSLLVILGFSAWTGGSFAEAIFGASNGIAVLGLFLMFIGIVIYLVELLFIR